MEKIEINPENYRRNTQSPPTMEIYDEWADLPYWPDLNCKTCKGAGILHPLQTDGKVDYARVVPCSAPGCLRDNIRAYRNGEPFARKHGVIDFEQTFETFVPVLGTENALEYARQLAFGTSPFIWLLICGGTGNGKTHLCNAMMREVLKRGIKAQLILSADFFSTLRIGMNDHSTDERMRKFKDIFFLIIDDCGLEYGSNWEEEKFDELMTARWMNCYPTVVTSNKTFDALPPRIKSRFGDGLLSRIVVNKAPDYRPGRK